MAGRDVVFTILAIDHASATLARVGAEAEMTGGKASRGAKAFMGAMNIMSLAIVGTAVKSVELGMKFQATMEMLHTQARVPQKDVDDLSGKVVDLAGAVGVGPESLADALYHIESSFASTGITGKKAMDVLRVAAEGAKIGHADLVDVTNALDAAITANIPGVQNFAQAMGSLNAAVGAGDMHMQDMANAFSTGMLATVKTYGLSLRDVSAALALFGDNNMRGQLAGNQLRMSMQAMVMPIKGAGEWLGKLGLTTTSLAGALRHGGMEEAVGLLVQHLRDAGVSSKETGDYITHAFGRKAGTGLNILIDQFERLKSKYKDIDHASQSFGQTWTDQQKLMQQQWDQLKAGAEALFTKIGLQLIPVVMDLGKKFGAAWDKMQPLVKDHSTVFTVLAVAIVSVTVAVKATQAAMAAAEAAQWAWTGATKAASVAMTAYKALNSAAWWAAQKAALLAYATAQWAVRAATVAWIELNFWTTVGLAAAKAAVITVATKAWAAGQWLLNVAMEANPIGLVVVAIAALTAGIIYAYKNSETFRDIVSDVWKVLKVVVVTGAKFIADTIMGMADVILHAADFAFGWIPGIGPKLHGAVVAFDKFRDSVNAALDGITKNTVAMVNVRVMINGNPVNISGNGSGVYNITGHTGSSVHTVTARARGGPVAAGVPYLVGESGPELFMPRSSGSIIPNGVAPAAGGGGDVHVHVHMQNGVVGDPAQVARYLSDVIRRTNGQGTALKFA